MPIDPVQMDLFGSVHVQVSPEERQGSSGYADRLKILLSQDLDFHRQNSNYATHNYHAFPAKFPPQLPRKFIEGLTSPGELVLDPMSGSGTTILEAMLLGRHGIGADIDPVAVNLAKVKVTCLDPGEIIEVGRSIIEQATHTLTHKKKDFESYLGSRFDVNTKKFLDYWFLSETQLEVLALVQAIDKIKDHDLRRFFQVALSSTIITKSGGISLAYDLAHTRPHRLKGKVPRMAIDEFEKRLNKNIKNICKLNWSKGQAEVFYGNAQALGLASNSIDLIVTSPPYASNAIDYMRAHKFSLVWFGYSIDYLSKKRRKYIGGERISGFQMRHLPDYPQQVVSKLKKMDHKKGDVLWRYYTEMNLCLAEMFRLLKPGKAAIIVVGSSVMRGIDTETAKCLSEIGQRTGFHLVGIAERRLDRNKRMMPARKDGYPVSKIEERMHKEYVLGFYKPV